MEAEIIVIRMGEFILKGKNRGRFENAILAQIRTSLKPFPRISVSREYGRVYVSLNGESFEAASHSIANIFGIATFSPAASVELEVQAIYDSVLGLLRERQSIPGSFKISVRRVNKNFPFDSQEMNKMIGGQVLQHYPRMKVDVHDPELAIKVELREKSALIHAESFNGLGGYPHGSNGRAMLMLSGGIDSPVAGWLAMRKGLKLEAVHFHSFPFTSERARQKVIDITRQLSIPVGMIRLHLVPFTAIQTRLLQSCQPNLMISLMRRAMFRITERLAAEHKAYAIVTGESLGQVASQTLPSMNAIGRVVDLPIIQPLITMDKQEIISIAQRIGTYPISILPYEDCCTLFVPKSPSTNPNIKVLEKIERSFLWLEDAINLAVSNTETSLITAQIIDANTHLF